MTGSDGEPGLLFVVGLGRSGTTALWDVLSAHDRIVLGCERFKRLWSPKRLPELTADHFRDPRRFFDFDDGLTNITPATGRRWAERYAAMEQRFHRAAYVGDKMTSIRIRALSASLPDPRFVVIVRDVRETAASWESRATNPDDRGWPERADGVAAVDAWDTGMRKVLSSQRRAPERVTVVEHASFFGDPGGAALLGVLDSLGLGPDDGVLESFDRAHRRYADTVADKPRTLPDEVTARIAERDAAALWARVSGLAL